MKLDVWSISIKKDLTVLKFLLGGMCESKKVREEKKLRFLLWE